MKRKTALLWTKLKSNEIEELRRQYIHFFPEFRLMHNEPLVEGIGEILQLEESGWFRRTTPYPVFLSYAPKTMEKILTITTYNEKDRMYVAEIDYITRQTAKAFRRMLKVHNLNFKTIYNAKFKERNYQMPKSELEERTKKIILKLAGLDGKV